MRMRALRVLTVAAVVGVILTAAWVASATDSELAWKERKIKLTKYSRYEGYMSWTPRLASARRSRLGWSSPSCSPRARSGF